MNRAAKTPNHQKSDLLDREIWKQFAINPDSAEKILISSFDSFNRWGMPDKTVYSEMQLCELYQYRKPDKVKALDRLERALKLLLKDREPMPDSTYLLIDIGNVFYRFDLSLQAMSFYRIQYNIISNNFYWHRKMLAAQNIAEVWSALHQPDSAIWYLRQADRFITDRSNLHRARNNQLLHAVLLRQPGFSDQEKLLDTASAIMFRFRDSRLTDPKTKTPRIEATWYEIMAEIHHTRFLQYFQQNNFIQAANDLDSALFYASVSKSTSLPVGYLIDKVRISGKTRHIPKLARYTRLADSAISVSADLSIRKAMYDSLASALSSCGQFNTEKVYRNYSAGLDDTLNRIREASAPRVVNVMQLSMGLISKYLIVLHDREQQKTAIIKAQRRTLMVTFTFLALITVFMIIYFLQKNRINKARKATVYQLKKRMMEENRSEVKKNPPGIPADFPEEKLMLVMQHDKPYLDAELSLISLADKIGTNRTYLSQFLNANLQTDFNSYINEYRIREVCRLLLSPEMDHLKTDTLAQMSGFKSRASFYAAFSKFTGMTPAVYKKINSQPA